MDVNRVSCGKWQDTGQIGGVDGAQRMGGDANARICWQPFGRMAHSIQQAGKAIHIIAKPPLPLGQWQPPGTAIAVKHRQMGQPDAGLTGGGKDAGGKLGHIGIGRAAGLVMQVMELAHRRKSRLLHFHEHQRRYRLDLFRCQAGGEPVHQITPGPETVTACKPVFGHPRHRTLKRMAVQVGQRGQKRRNAGIIGLG